MARKVNLESSQDTFDFLWETLERSRKNADYVRVSKHALAGVLRDHGRLIRAFREDIEGER